MASSSSASSSSIERWTYDVFLSFRGEDTRKTFVDHLYAALDNNGIITYKDDVTLERGRSISPELLQAINQSRCAVIVFSKNYASSSWCLDELVHIMDSKRNNSQIVFPVFYDVAPTDVRKQTGHFGDVFSKHTSERVQVWRESLFEASNISGWETNIVANGHEAQCIKDIVKSVSLELRGLHYTVDENLVGMESRIQELESSLGIRSGGVRMIGIWGMGGGGKTTLARAIYDKYSAYFEGSTFVENVREASQNSYLQHLQKQILSVVNKNLEVNNVSDGIRLMSKRLCNKHFLIVLDDVDHVDQLRALAGDSRWFCKGSRIIITTRNKKLLVAHQVDVIHNVSLLNDEEALMLFCKYASRKNVPLPGYEKASQEVVHYSAGLPLTLKVLGSSLCGDELPIWKSTLEKLQKIPENETIKKLEISFDSLDNLQKEMFLDIAYLCRGLPIHEVSSLLDSCGYFAKTDLRVLEHKSLIVMDSDHCKVHDLLVEMATDIVRRAHPNEPGKHSRLNRPEEVLDVLQNNKGTEEIKTMVVNMFGKEAYVNLAEAFRSMPNLRLLHVSNVKKMTFKGPIYLPEELRFIHFHDYPLSDFPKELRFIHVILFLLGLWMVNIIIRKLWRRDIKPSFGKLTCLYIVDSKKLTRTPNFMSMPNLKRVAFRHCINLRMIHSSIGKLHSLVHLDLSGCLSLCTLPGSISELKCLERLDLCLCSRLQQLPENMGSSAGLAYLNYLDLQLCISLKYLPPRIGRLPRLETLLLKYSGLVELPDSICLLDCLRSLEVSCLPLNLLPNSICQLKFLRTLKLSASRPNFDLQVLWKIKELPSDLGNMECLEELRIDNADIELIPDSICQLKCLKTLMLCENHKLKELPSDLGNMECLEKLCILIGGITLIPDSICRLKFLKTLQIYNCSELMRLPRDLGSLECLEVLDLERSGTEQFPIELPDSICELKRLTTLKLTHFSLPKELPSNLEKLYLYYSPIERVPDNICGLKHLKTLGLESCVKLKELPTDLGNVECLEELHLHSCKSIEFLPDSICRLKCLKKLQLYECSNLKELPSNMVKMECLMRIHIRKSGIKSYSPALEHLIYKEPY